MTLEFGEGTSALHELMANPTFDPINTGVKFLESIFPSAAPALAAITSLVEPVPSTSGVKSPEQSAYYLAKAQADKQRFGIGFVPSGTQVPDAGVKFKYPWSNGTPESGASEAKLTPASALSSAMTYGLAGTTVGAISGIVSSGLNFALGEQQLSLQRESFERDWEAARTAGLLHPSQFGTIAGQVGTVRNSGRIQSAPRTTDLSSYGISF